MIHAPKEFPYTLKDGAKRSGYNLHYFRRMCRAGKIKCTQVGRHIFFSAEQYLALPVTPHASSGSGSIFDGLDVGEIE